MKVMRSVIIEAPINTVWSVIREFDGVHRWNPGVSAALLERGGSTTVGAVRKLNIADGSVFRETLLAHSDLDHFYTYNIIESPLPCRHYVACHQLIEITDGNATLGVWSGEFDCDEADAQQLESIVGDGIYLAAQKALNHYVKETQ